MAIAETVQARNQPFRTKRWRRGKVQDTALALMSKQVNSRCLHIFERCTDVIDITATCFSKYKPLLDPLKQQNPQVLLHQPDLPADRALGEVQFSRRFREAKVTRCRFECAQSSK